MTSLSYSFIMTHILFLESKNYIFGEEMWKGPICNVPLGIKGVAALVGCVLLVILFFPMCFFTCLCVKDHVGDVGMMSYCSSDLWKADKWTERTRVDRKLVSEHASIQIWPQIALHWTSNKINEIIYWVFLASFLKRFRQYFIVKENHLIALYN